MLILSADEMQACDRVTEEQFGGPLGDLMASAGRAVAGFVRLYFPAARRITVLCGRGNNGGDGLHAARLLAQAGFQVTVLLLGDPSLLRDLAADAWRDLLARPGLVATRVVLTAEELGRNEDALAADLIVDAVVGTGFKPPLRGLPLALAELLRESKVPVLAVDLPSGWDADSRDSKGGEAVFPADAVVTFTAPKPAHVFGELTRRWDQPIVVAGIGSPEAAVVSGQRLRWAGSAKAMTDKLRPTDSNKGKFGHVLVVGGSVGRSGAPAMAALAAMRAGAGLVTAAIPAPVQALVAGVAPELMTHPLLVDGNGLIAGENSEYEPLKELLDRKTVLAVGPGMGPTGEAAKFAFGLIASCSLPVVLDADALNLLAGRPSMLPTIARGRTLVLTPHPGEMARLTGKSIAEIQARRLEIARDFAVQHNLILVLKGWRTLIAHPDGTVGVITTGNPAMAKGGSGDLLTGIVAGLLAQHPEEPGKAVEAAVYLHGLAADLALREQDQHTLLATDSLAYLYRAFRYHPQDVSGYCWLQGLAGETNPAAPVREVIHG